MMVIKAGPAVTDTISPMSTPWKKILTISEK
jgi:hypothetical protein